ncbi:MAG: type II toxin-antitoxin system Phd/YefM family antitoxin [Acidobacteriota bacterium]
MIISEFKAKCIAVIREAQATREPVVITRRGRPVARIEPIVETDRERQLGIFRGRMKIKGDIVAADSTEDWEMLK